MPSSLRPPSLLAVTRVLLALRLRVTRDTVARSPAAQTASFIALLLVCPAAWHVGGRAGRLMAAGDPGAFAAVCAALLLLTLLYVALLLAGSGGFGGVMEPPPASVLRALPVSPGVTLLADTVSFLASLPTLFIVIALIPMANHRWQSLPPLALLVAFALLFALLLGRAGMLLAKRGRTGLILAAGAALFLGVVILRAAPAAALSSVVNDTKPPVRLPWDPPPPPSEAPAAVLRLSPPGLAATCLTGPGGAAASAPLTILAAVVALTAAGTVLLDRVAERAEPASDAKPRRARAAPRRVSPLGTEARLLLRDPSAHASLRGPASLLLAVGYAWMAPNLGADAVRNLADLLGIGITLYLLLWQTQFVCDRFGSEAGSAATLFSLPMSRRRILFHKNISLLALLAVIDGILLSGFALVAGNPRLIPTLLLGLIPVLTLATALGNLVSVFAPFPLRRKTERYEREPERSLIFVYGVVGIGTWLLFLPMTAMGRAFGLGGYALGTTYVVAVYAASVWLAARLLTPARERRIITLLDGVK